VHLTACKRAYLTACRRAHLTACRRVHRPGGLPTTAFSTYQHRHAGHNRHAVGVTGMYITGY